MRKNTWLVGIAGFFLSIASGYALEAPAEKPHFASELALAPHPEAEKHCGLSRYLIRIETAGLILAATIPKTKSDRALLKPLLRARELSLFADSAWPTGNPERLVEIRHESLDLLEKLRSLEGNLYDDTGIKEEQKLEDFVVAVDRLHHALVHF